MNNKNVDQTDNNNDSNEYQSNKMTKSDRRLV
jgi:hypothetical protein